MFARRAGTLALLTLLSLGIGVFDHELWPPTEQAVAGVTWEMYRSDDLWVPTIDGLPYLEKPPLAYLLSWLAFEAAGHPSAGLLRLPAALAGLASLLIVLASAWRLYGEAVAWSCALLCALTVNFFGIMHRASTDSIAVFFTFLCFAIFVSSLTTQAPDPKGGRAPHLGRDIALAAVLALSFLVKNFYTYLVVLPPVALFLLWRGGHRRLARLALLCAVAFAVVVVPWVLALYARGGTDYLRVVFFDNTIGRFTNIGPPSGAHLPVLDDAFSIHKNESLLTGLRAVTEEMVPWLLIYAAALWAALRKPFASAPRTFLLIALGVMPLALTLSATRVESYYRPIVFVLVLIAGDYFAEHFAGRVAGWQRRLVTANIALVAILVTTVPILIGRYLGAPAIEWLSAPFALALCWLAWRWRAQWGTPQALRSWAHVIAMGFAITLGMTYPELDTHQSWRPFFDVVRSTLDEHRELWTTFVDDRKLPAMTFYLDRRVKLVKSPLTVPELLARSIPVGIIVSVEQFAELEPELCAIPHRVLRADLGKNLFVYLENTGTGEGKLLSQRVPERCSVGDRLGAHIRG